MNTLIKKLLPFLCSLLLSSFFYTGFVYAQTPTETITPTGTTTVTPTPDNTSQKEDLQKRIQELEGKVSDLKSQGDSLSSQIGAMDNQIKLTEYRMDATKKEIMDVTIDIDSAAKRMQNLEGSLEDVSKTLINRIVATYQMGEAQTLQVLLASNDVSDLASRANYLRLVQEHDKKLLYDIQQSRNDYANQKTILEGKKKKIEELNKQLETYSTQLDADKKSKEKLLADTKGNEANYQKLLSQARAQLAGFSRFATSQGGASILPAQPSPDGWYYNQRDERWGNNSIGSSGEPVWKYGCLLTSIAMVLKQRGDGVTPLDVSSNGSYFFADTAYMNLPWGGGAVSSTWGRDLGAIDSKLSSGKPVIVGLSAGAYGTHFIVLKSGSGGNYVMNDPWYGPDLDFSSHYSTGQIFQYGWAN
jgi:peptidoglycan hydrolase CwlO-like protein